jgi:hypothetical protein
MKNNLPGRLRAATRSPQSIIPVRREHYRDRARAVVHERRINSYHDARRARARQH